MRKEEEISLNSSNEKADSQMLFHTKSIYAPNAFVIRTTDTDVLVTALFNMFGLVHVLYNNSYNGLI